MTRNLVTGITTLATKTIDRDVPGAVVGELDHAADDGRGRAARPSVGVIIIGKRFAGT